MRLLLFLAGSVVLLIIAELLFLEKMTNPGIHTERICSSIPPGVTISETYEYTDIITSTVCRLQKGSDKHVYFNVLYSSLPGCIYSEILTHYQNSRDVLSVFRGNNDLTPAVKLCLAWAGENPKLSTEYQEYFKKW